TRVASDARRGKPLAGSDRATRHRDRARPPSGQRIQRRLVECTTCPFAKASDRFRPSAGGTVSRETLWRVLRRASSPAKSSKVQRERPAGGLEQAVATSKASSLPVSLRRAPGRGSSLSAAATLPSTKRRLVRYTVESPTPMLLAISS